MGWRKILTPPGQKNSLVFLHVGERRQRVDKTDFSQVQKNFSFCNFKKQKYILKKVEGNRVKILKQGGALEWRKKSPKT